MAVVERVGVRPVGLVTAGHERRYPANISFRGPRVLCVEWSA